MATTVDKESIRQAYDMVRDDKSDTNWAVFNYDGNKIVVKNTGVEFQEFASQFNGKKFILKHIGLLENPQT
jgi:hypothetical protein